MAMWLSEQDKPLSLLPSTDFDPHATSRLGRERAFNIAFLAAEMHCAATSNKKDHPASMLAVLRTMPSWALAGSLSDADVDVMARQMARSGISKKAEIVNCKDCGEEFTITPQEAGRLEDKGFKLPVRCVSSAGKQRSGASRDRTEVLRLGRRRRRLPGRLHRRDGDRGGTSMGIRRA